MDDGRHSTRNDDEAWAEPIPERPLSRLQLALARLARERREAPCLLQELLALPDSERRDRVRRDPRFLTLGLCELVVQRGLDDGFDDPRRALATAELGIELAGRLDPSYYGQAVVHDALARAWGYLGNARRVSSDLQGAEQALARAEALLPLGSYDPIEEARLLDFRASLLFDRGHDEAALDEEDRVIAICKELNDSHRHGRALIKRGLLLTSLDRHDEGLAAIEQALTLIEPEGEPRLLLVARHNLLRLLNLCGRSEEALVRLEQMRAEYLETQEAWWLWRFQWLEAEILANLGRRDEAVDLLEQVRQKSLQEGRLIDVAWAALQLALLLLDLGRPCEATAAAGMAFAVFAAVDAGPPALAAALLHARAQALQDGG